MSSARHSPGAYSRLVSFLKILLPLLALAILSSVFLTQTEDTFEGGLVFSKTDLETLGDGLTIRDPRFTGTSSRGDLFSISAETATPDRAQPKLIDIVNTVTEAKFADGLGVTLTAAKARADLTSQVVTLSGGLRIVTSDGYVILSDGGIADLRAGMVTSSGPVTADGPAGKIEAGRVKFETQSSPAGTGLENRIVKFDNGVRVTITPRTTGTAQ